MKNRIPLIAGITMMATVATTSLTFAGGTMSTKENVGQDRRLNYLDYLAKSKKDVGAISTGVDALLKTVREALATNDKAKMKAALSASEKHLIEMKANTESCMKNMESMESEMHKDGHMEGKAAETAP